MRGRIKVEYSLTGTAFTRAGRYVINIKTNDKLPQYIEYVGNIINGRLQIKEWKEVEKFKPTSQPPRKNVDYGADLETAVLKDGKILLPKEMEGANKKNSKAIILSGAFVSKTKTYVYDSTRADEKELHDFLFNKENKLLRFYNLEFDGKYILAILFEKGYKEVDEFTYSDEKEFVALKNPMGKIFQIEYRIKYKFTDPISNITVSDSYTTKLLDTYKLFPGTSLAKGLKSFKVKGDNGRPLEKMDMKFEREYVFDKDGYLTKNFLLYMKKDAEGARKLYHTFIDELGHKKKKTDYLTIGAVAWDEMINCCFDGDKKNFKLVTGDIGKDVEDKYRGMLYRGGYGILNNKYYRKEIKNVYHADYVSMYPSLMVSEVQPIGGGVEYPYYKKPDKYKPIAVHHITVKRATIKEGYFPILINGRKKEGFENYCFEILEEQDFMLFEEFGKESEYSIFLRTYEGLDFKVNSSRLFEGQMGLFDNFVDKWFAVKEQAEKDSPQRSLAKLLLNNSFGKIGEGYKKEKTKFICTVDNEFVVLTRNDDYNEKETRNVFIASNITHRGRVKIWLDAEKVGFKNVIMLATDSLFWVGNKEMFVFGKKLGDLDLEHEGVSLWCYGDKAYQMLTSEGLITKCNGMKDEVRAGLKFMDLDEGLKFNMLKKVTYKGGSVLTDTVLSLKPRIITNKGV